VYNLHVGCCRKSISLWVLPLLTPSYFPSSHPFASLAHTLLIFLLGFSLWHGKIASNLQSQKLCIFGGAHASGNLNDFYVYEQVGAASFKQHPFCSMS
jgi:hypothetical protein